MSKHEFKIPLAEVARFKFSFPLTRTGTKVAEYLGMTKTQEKSKNILSN